jgi:cytoskeletal protein CcmA (bactofilin family)
VFSKNANANDRRSSAVTIIGPSASIDGNIVFSGYLRVQGSVVGNVTCSSEATGTTVIHGAGSVAGAIKTPNIVVGGQVQGPLDATESIEIHDGAAVVGDARYKLLSIQEGGFIDGKLMPTATAETTWPHQERRVAASDAPAIKQLDGPHAHARRAGDRFWRPGKLLVVAGLIAGLGAYYWRINDRAPGEPTDLAVAPLAESRTSTPAEPVVPAKIEEPPPAPKVETTPPPPVPAPTPKPVANATPAPPPAPVLASAPSLAPAPEPAKADTGRIITVQGLDVDKPTDVFFVATREAVVLYKKQRDDSGEGTRIELANGTKQRISISENELVRVARGKNIDLFYQGRKLSPSIVQTGAWISFLPLRDETPPKPPAAQAE